jgi:plastocyanin
LKIQLPHTAVAVDPTETELGANLIRGRAMQAKKNSMTDRATAKSRRADILRAGGRLGVAVSFTMLLILLAARPAAAQSLLDRPANMIGTWVGSPGTVHFHFLHRFADTGEPQRKVLNSPTFLLAASLPAQLLVGARYATNSSLVLQVPNEWEFFGRYNPIAESRGALLDLSLHAGYNHAGESVDAELTLARTFSRLRLLAGARGFSNFARSDESRWALAGGATVRVHRFIALAADVASLLDAEDDEETAWSGGVHLQIPYTPHTLSLHYSNTNTTTLEGASVGAADGRWGFEFTVPFTLSRYFGSGARAETEAAPRAAGAEAGRAAEVTMSNRLTFEPRTIRVKVGETVVWRNTSDVVHTVTADPARAANRANVALPTGGPTFNSGDMAPGATFRHTFTVAGEYKYICIPHELAGMLGTVVVEE